MDPEEKETEQILRVVETIAEVRGLTTQLISDSTQVLLSSEVRSELRGSILQELLRCRDFFQTSAMQIGEMIPFYERLAIEFPDPADEVAWRQHVRRLLDDE